MRPTADEAIFRRLEKNALEHEVRSCQMAVTKADLHRKVDELPERALELADQLLESAAHDPIQEEGERILRDNPGLRARLDEIDRKLKAGEPLQTVEHEELRRRLKAKGVPLDD